MKRAFDLVLAAVLGLLLLLPALVVAVAVRLGSPGPALYRAERVGRGGRRFRMLKFRTMRVGADSGSGITTRDDDRVTGLGRFLRAFRIDEWPQLWNVLVGDMSLVGPRPETPRFVALDDPLWQEVLSIRPGITGLAQLDFADHEQDLLGDDDPERDYRERVQPAKLAMDARYVRTRSLGGDVVLLVRTLFRVVTP